MRNKMKQNKLINKEITVHWVNTTTEIYSFS